MKENKKKRRGKAGRTLKKWIKRLILLIIIAAAALFGAKAYIKNQAANTKVEDAYDQTQVMRGAIVETVYGTGTTSARNQPNLLAEADGTLTSLRVSVGDAVKKGDILAVLTNEEADDKTAAKAKGSKGRNVRLTARLISTDEKWDVPRDPGTFFYNTHSRPKNQHSLHAYYCQCLHK